MSNVILSCCGKPVCLSVCLSVLAFSVSLLCQSLSLLLSLSVWHTQRCIYPITLNKQPSFHTHTHQERHTCTHMKVYTHTHHTHTHIHSYIHLHPDTHTFTHIHEIAQRSLHNLHLTHTHLIRLIHAHTKIQGKRETCTHTHTHTHDTHTHTQESICSRRIGSRCQFEWEH